MTRTARRSQRKTTLIATPWSILKRKFSSRYSTLEEDNDPESGSASEATSCTSTSAETMDDSDSSSEHKVTCSPAFIRSRIKRSRAAESDFKETKKTKLSGNAAKRFFQKIKQKFTTRKLRRNLKKVEVAPLLSEDSYSGSDGAGPVLNFRSKKKKSKKTKSKATAMKNNIFPFGGNDTKPLLDKGAESEDESVCGSEQEGEEEEEEINTDVGLQPRERPARNDRMEIEVVTDKKKRQNEARRLRRHKKKVCFNCRQSGHLFSECRMPQASGTGICFKCGSATHTSKNCRAKVPPGQYPYAKCFICQETGHLSSACPDNPKGLYPYGGCCNVCGSVEHLKSNCPQRAQQEQSRYEPWGSSSLVITNHRSLDAEEFEVHMDTNSSSSRSTAPNSKSVSSHGLATIGTAFRPRPKVVHF